MMSLDGLRSSPPRPPAFPPLAGAARWRGRKIGLLGGSFNPAHEGHLHISLHALKRLGLDDIWWLVSPQNPLKSADGMASLDNRMASARAIIGRHPHLHVTDIEHRLGTRYSIDSIQSLQRLLPHSHFLWLMGADNLQQFPRWRQWTEIMGRMPLAIFDREHYSRNCLTGKVASRYRRGRLNEGALKSIATAKTPAWIFLSLRRHPASATEIREAQPASSPFSVAMNSKE
ncbi:MULTISPECIES: nicotinate-nucleotide adenylyltransferase [unclassified Iodidimonas]|jgi:nicotinate-nucleotide adenylyltransferase|uniref:nicotinate-nucleotide adenylyltransferase n=1 Tax=unclassified Iodidimonas TaxID=2626145 RepID=UPI002482927D|nr:MULTISPECIES: nicotinate-nucleotide adenylyltransferase [unclassified Iodidimonas]